MAYYNDATTKSSSLVSRLQSGVEAVKQRYAQHRIYKATRDELIALTDRDLADLGLSRGEIHFVAREAASK